ncbi:MAG: hypothetical protein RBS80_06160 [Thermoguttaceae bacterium]|nr:hypothetical protein [Thermoguttaceae bacterium]
MIPILYQGGGRCDEFFYAHPESEAVFDLPQGADRFMAVGYAMLSQRTTLIATAARQSARRG